ncbi:MAG: MBL fold metallo-hydrolase [Nitrospinota bacterium]
MAGRVKAFPGPARTRGFIETVPGIYVGLNLTGGRGGAKAGETIDERSGGDTNFGLILTRNKPIVIDNDIRARKEFVSGMRRITRKAPGFLLNTHHNFDHTSDNAYYHKQGAVSFGAGRTRQEMEREHEADIWVRQMAGRILKVEHLIGKLGVAPPMVTFEDELTIRYGGRTLQMISIGHCHTKSDTVIWMPDEKVLFMGDAFDYRTHPVVRIGNILNWIGVLDQLRKFPARQIVPGHGPLPPPGESMSDRVQGIFDQIAQPHGGGPSERKNPRPGRQKGPDG